MCQIIGSTKPTSRQRRSSSSVVRSRVELRYSGNRRFNPHPPVRTSCVGLLGQLEPPDLGSSDPLFRLYRRGRGPPTPPLGPIGCKEGGAGWRGRPRLPGPSKRGLNCPMCTRRCFQSHICEAGETVFKSCEGVFSRRKERLSHQ